LVEFDDTAAVRELRWGLKSSFIRYVRASGSHEITGSPAPIVVDDETIFRFESASPSDDSRFRGVLSVVAHGGMLEVWMADPEIEDGELTVRLRDGGRVPIARVEPLSSSEPGEVRYSVRLLESAEPIFNNVYFEGTPLSQLVIRAER